MASKSAISIITAVCLALICISPLPAFAASADTASKPSQTDGIPGLTTGSAISIIDFAGEAVIDMASSANSTVRNPMTVSIFNAFNITLIADTALDTALPEEDEAEPEPEPETPTTGGAVTVPEPEDDASLWYSSKIPMKKEHQELLWDYCQTRELDYIDMLALISLESNFDEKCSSGKYKGYFQISSAHGANLSKTLKTPNKPLDGAININWGTAMYSWILADKRVKGLTGKQQRDAALSIYQRGSGGYDRYGLSKSFLAKYYKKRDMVVSYFKQAD